MLIHFPSALLPMDFVCYGLFYYTHQPSFALAFLYALFGAVVLGWAAALFGILDILKIPPVKTDALQKSLIHGGINVSVINKKIYLIYCSKAYEVKTFFILKLILTAHITNLRFF